MEKCDDTGKCDTWPQEQCSLSKKNVTKTTPNTGCDKIPRMMCTPVGCKITEGEVVCREEPRSSYYFLWTLLYPSHVFQVHCCFKRDQ